MKFRELLIVATLHGLTLATIPNGGYLLEGEGFCERYTTLEHVELDLTGFTVGHLDSDRWVDENVQQRVYNRAA